MKKCFLYLLMVGGLGACIQSEPLNAEADITACKILNAKGSPETNIKGNIIINNAQVLAQANPSIDLTKLALEVTLTEGGKHFARSGPSDGLFASPEIYRNLRGRKLA